MTLHAVGLGLSTYATDRPSEYDLLAPRRLDAESPFWWAAPVPMWGINPGAAGPRLVGLGCGEGCGCTGCAGVGADDAYHQVGWGTVALVGAGALVVGILIGYTAGGTKYRPNYPTGRVGSGARFRALSHKLRARGDVRDPDAVAASIGRKKYGKRRFQAMAAAGRRRRRSAS